MTSKTKNGTSAATTEVPIITRDGQDFTEIKEGLARILVPFSAKDASGKKLNNVEEQQKVFYNPIQQFNRDLTVLAIKAYGQETLAKRHPANADRVAKRKREKLDTGGNKPKKQEKAVETTQGDTSMVDTPEKNEAHPSEADVAPSDQQNGHEQGPQEKPPNETEESPQEKPQDKSSGDTRGSNGDLTSSDIPNANQTAGDELSTKGQETKPSETKRTSGPTFTILDALSATGLRALRYAQELPFVTSVTANDLSPTAVEAIKRNAEHNGIQSKVNATSGDARAHMYSLLTQEEADDGAKGKNRNKKSNHKPNKKYDVIDLDPYGTAAPFFDAALNAIRDDGGLLCVTCTDSAVWASNGYPEKAFALYGGVPVKGFHSHEVGLRLILHGLATAAARYGLAIEPLLSLSVDYYTRVFVKVRKSPAQVKFLAGKTMIAYNCDQGCGAWETQFLARNRKAPNKSGRGVFYKHGFAIAPTVDQLCKECNSKMHLAGPMYGGPLHSTDFINKILDELPNVSDDVYGTKPRIEGMLHTALEEFLPSSKDHLESSREDEYATVDPYPFFFHPTSLARVVHCICPDEDSFRGALRHLGYHVTRSHCKPGSLKTNAPWSVIWDIMREWIRQHPIKVEKVKENTPAYTLLRLGKKDEAVKDEVATDKTADDEGTRGEPTKDTQNDDVDKLEIVFNQKLGRDTSKAGLTRYQTNPTENWGPQTKAKER